MKLTTMKLTKDPLKRTPCGTVAERRRLLKKGVKDFLKVGTLATIFFMVADFVPLNAKWESVQNESYILVGLLAAVSAVCLDLPMYIAGKKVREFMDGLVKKRRMLIILALAIGAFFIVYIPYALFSFSTKESVFQEALPLEASSSVLGMSFGEATTSEGNPLSVTHAALFSLLLPMATSASSFVCGLVFYHPIDDELEKLYKVVLHAKEHQQLLKQGRAELSSDRTEFLVNREKDLYESHLADIKAQAQVRIQAYKEALEEHLDVEGALHVIEGAQKEIEEAFEEFDKYSSSVVDVLKARGTAPSTE